jgi:hypothetical protein
MYHQIAGKLIYHQIAEKLIYQQIAGKFWCDLRYSSAGSTFGFLQICKCPFLGSKSREIFNYIPNYAV